MASTSTSSSSNTSLSKIIFYDIEHTLTPSSRSWSPATIRTALALKHRNLPHTRQAVSYPDIAELLRSHDVPEATKGSIKYTLPAISIHYADGTEKWVMDSVAIAPVLEELVPVSAEHPSLYPDGEQSKELVKQIDEVVGKSFGVIWAHVVPFVPAFLDKRGSDYFYETRERMLKRNLADMREESGKEDVHTLLKNAVDMIANVYVQALEGGNQGKGPFMGGKDVPSYADFVAFAALEWWRCSRGDEIVDKAVQEVESGILMPMVEKLTPVLRG